MVIKNSTTWDTSDLRKLFRRCVKEVDKVEQPRCPFHRRNKRFKLDVLNARRHKGINGRAHVNGYWIMVKLGFDSAQRMTFEQRHYLAYIFIHEYYHTIGYRNHDRKNYKFDITKTYNRDWVKDYPVTQKEVVKEPKIDIKLQRYQSAIVNLRRAETRFKRAKTLLNKWQGKVNRYETVYNYQPK